MTFRHLPRNVSHGFSALAGLPSPMPAIERGAMRDSGMTGKRWFRRTLDTLPTWQKRARGRYQLTQLDDHLLNDIGKTRADIAIETQKPFWRA